VLGSEDLLSAAVFADTDSIGIRLEPHDLFVWQPEVDSVFSTTEIDCLSRWSVGCLNGSRRIKPQNISKSKLARCSHGFDLAS